MNVDDRTRRPIYDGTRMFLGVKDLVLSFYTQKCQFQCSFCTLPMRSANEPVTPDDLNAQIDWVFEKYAASLPALGQVSFGNEGSALDEQRFFPESMQHLLERARAMTNLEVLSIETRPEYVKPAVLEKILTRTHARKVDVTIGLEAQSDWIRNGILNKSISRRIFEQRLDVLGQMGVRLTSYVMVKPAPRMTEEEGVREAVATIEYLAESCAKRNVELLVYLTPTYIAKGSYLALNYSKEEYAPPTIQSVLRVIVEGRRRGVPIYTGLWSEDLAEEGNDFRGRRGYDPTLRKAILRFNQTNDFSHLQPFLDAVIARPAEVQLSP